MPKQKTYENVLAYNAASGLERHILNSEAHCNPVRSSKQ